MSEQPETSKNVESNAESNVQPNEDSQKNLFDYIGDFFAKMLKGIFIFVFCKLPCKLWRILSDIEQLKKLLRYLGSIIRAIVLCMIWISVVFLGWWLFLREQFIRFWKMVWNWIYMFFSNTFEFIRANAGWLWMILALCGSIYGLLYVTLKRRAKKKGEVFLGVFGWMKRKKTNIQEKQNDKEKDPSFH